MNTRTGTLLLAAMLIFSTVAIAQEDQSQNKDAKAEAPRVGAFQMTRPGIKPSTAILAVVRSVGFRTPEIEREYRYRARSGDKYEVWDEELGDPQWEVYVPRNYDPTMPAGVFAFVNAGNEAVQPGQWYATFDKYNLIYIAPHKAGNSQATYWRCMVTMAGIEALAETYNLDKERIYVSGSSGGGRVSSVLAYRHGDLFTGAMPMVGVNPITKVKIPGDKDGRWWTGIIEADPKILSLVRKRSRFVYFTGDGDFNRVQTKTLAEEGQKMGFDILYLEAPNHGHSIASAAFLETGLQHLDAPLKKGAEKSFRRAQQLDGRKQHDLALEAYKEAVLHGAGTDWVAEARQRMSELDQMRKEAIAAVKELIAKGDLREAQIAINTLRREWRKSAQDDAVELTKQLREARINARSNDEDTADEEEPNE